jgi:hypothetical protein
MPNKGPAVTGLTSVGLAQEELAGHSLKARTALETGSSIPCFGGELVEQDQKNPGGRDGEQCADDAKEIAADE